MAPRKKAVSEDTKDMYDQFLVEVIRAGNVDPATGTMKGVTRSIRIMNEMRRKQPNTASLIEQLNAKCGDHQNPLGNSTPMIVYWFPHGLVKKGDEYKSNDIKQKVLVVDEETGDESMVAGKNIIGIKIHLDKKIAGWNGSKPIFEVEETEEK